MIILKNIWSIEDAVCKVTQNKEYDIGMALACG